MGGPRPGSRVAGQLRISDHPGLHQSTFVDSVVMGLKVDTADLVSAGEVADLLGLAHHNSVTTYLHRYDDFPRPVVDKSSGHIRLWLRQDITDWRSGREVNR